MADPAKAKTSKLTLEIYLRNGKGTNKPDATVTLPVTVK